MADVLTTTTQLSEEMSVFYDKVFLERAELNLKHDVLATKKTVPTNSGKVVYFTRQTPFDPATSALTEGVNPDAVGFSAENVSATLAEYGNVSKVSSLFSLTAIDAGLKEKVETMGQNAGETIDTLLRDQLYTGATVQLAGGNSALSALAATDTMSVVELRKAVKTLKRNKAPKFEDGLYRGVLSVQGTYDLMGDSNQGNFVTANKYGSADMIKKGLVGKLAGVNIFESNNEKSESSTVTVYSNFVGGKGCLGMIDIAGKGKKIYYKKPGKNDTSNPLDMYATLGWKIPAFATKVLNSDWVINIKIGS